MTLRDVVEVPMRDLCRSAQRLTDVANRRHAFVTFPAPSLPRPVALPDGVAAARRKRAVQTAHAPAHIAANEGVKVQLDAAFFSGFFFDDQRPVEADLGKNQPVQATLVRETPFPSFRCSDDTPGDDSPADGDVAHDVRPRVPRISTAHHAVQDLVGNQVHERLGSRVCAHQILEGLAERFGNAEFLQREVELGVRSHVTETGSVGCSTPVFPRRVLPGEAWSDAQCAGCAARKEQRTSVKISHGEFLPFVSRLIGGG